jgi:CubicO group peptidase (beta-lactamase class C family)
MKCNWKHILFAIGSIGFNPATSGLEIDTTVEIKFATQPGYIYEIESSTDLTHWQPMGPWLTGDGELWRNVLSSTQEAQLYRLNEQQWIDLTNEVETLRQQNGLPALALAVIKNGDLYGVGVSGTRRMGVDAPVTITDKWHHGSITKSMTATLAAILVEGGLIGWDTTIGDVFPERVDTMATGWSTVSLEQLLSHTAGAPQDLSVDDIWTRLWNFAGTPVAGRQALLDEILTRATAYTPGQSHLYSNAGYAIAGAMLERLSGTAWEDLIKEHLFEPLGMHSAGFGAPVTPRHLDQPLGHGGSLSAPYIYDGGVYADNPPAIGPGATVHCSLIDLARYVTLHLRGARNEPTRLLSPSSFSKLHSTISGIDYALGWYVYNRDWGGGNVLHHMGSNLQWLTNIWIAPEKNWAVIACMNFGGDNSTTLSDNVVVHGLTNHGP